MTGRREDELPHSQGVPCPLLKKYLSKARAKARQGSWTLMHGGGAQFIRSLVNHLATLSENYKRTPPPPPPGMDGERVDFSSFAAGWRRERRLRLVVVNSPPFETHPPPYFCIIPPVFVPSSFAPSWGGGRRLCPLLRKGKEELFPERGTLSVSFFSLIPPPRLPPP